MGRFFPLYIRRSDGVLEVTASNGKREKNEPTAEQLDSTPDAKGVSDYYRLLSPSDAKYLDWMKKLGGMLIRELGDGEHGGADKAYLLYEMPTNYRLYEHIKTKAQPAGDDGEGEVVKSSKNHAGGNNERQDAYLYGHPLGRKKRYRSPGDFFPHLLWLATDDQNDPDNCACKVCAPDELQPEEEKTNVDTAKAENADSRPSTAQTTTGSALKKTSTLASQIPQATQSGVGAHPNNASQPGPTPIPQPLSIDQQVDLQFNLFLYRQGELVWYFRGQAWGLAVVTRRYNIRAAAGSPDIKCYYVQPLSHPFDQVRQVPVLQEDNMRPWLAWSPPGFTLKAFNQVPNLSYDSVDWQAVINGQFGNGDPQVDGAILAARAIDATYSLFGPLEAASNDPNRQERHWNGVYIGAEKFWVGDIVRLKVGSGRDILVISDIIDRPRQPNDASGGSQVQLVGDVYQQVEGAAGSALPSDIGQPVRLREDMSRRRAITAPTKRIVSAWKLMNGNARIGVGSIKGRWYEATILLPILQGPEPYAQRCATGDIADSGNMMNARGEAQTVDALKEMPVWRQSRIDALGRTVPQGLEIRDGIDTPSPAEAGEVVRRVHDASSRGQQPEVPMGNELMNFTNNAGGQPQHF